MRLLINTAAQDDRIRAAYLEGSRVNPDVPRDMFQDYDVVYIVKETASFQKDNSWIDRFGERLYMQYPEDSVYDPGDKENCYGWLMQLRDGNRIDLHVCTQDYAKTHLEAYQILLDKDGILPQPSKKALQQYWIQKPSQQQFSCTCNEYRWCLNNVAKGWKRNELPYALDVIGFTLRPMLERLLEWKIAIVYNIQISAEKCGKYMEQLSSAIHQTFPATYAKAESEALWQAVFRMCELFHETAIDTGCQLDLTYDTREASNSMKYLKDVYYLPKGAKELYE